MQVPAVEMERMPPAAVIDRRASQLLASVFAGKKPATGRKPVAIVTLGVQGAGKSTAIKRIAPRSFVQIDPDRVFNTLLHHGPLPDGGPVYSLSDEWTDRIINHAVRLKYDFVLDSAFPSSGVMRLIKRHGYRIEMLLVRTKRDVAREREVSRDLRRGWGTVGISLKSHRRTRDKVARIGPSMARAYADSLTVCDNNGTVMKCMQQPSISQAASMFRM